MTSQRVAVVTGSNKGIGYAIVRVLLKEFKGEVYLTARDETRGLQAVEDLKKEGLRAPKFHQLDINSLESIQRLRDHLKATYGGLDVLVNNAAMAYPNASTAPFAEQAEVTNRTNFWATLDICNELFPLLRKNARVVNLSSVGGHLNFFKGKEPEVSHLKKTLADPNIKLEKLKELVSSFVRLTKEGKHLEHGWPNSAYGVSKAAVNALTVIQQREMDKIRPNDNILINCVHPGYVDTDMTNHKGHLTIDQGAAAPAWLALLPADAKSPRGAFVWHNKQVTDWTQGTTPTPI